MTKLAQPNLIDISIKEGNFRIQHRILLPQVADLTRELQRSKIRFAEVCHGCGIGGFRRGYPGLHHDKDILKTARESAPDLQYVVYLAAYPYSVTELEWVHDLFSIGRVGVNVDDLESGKDPIQRLKALKKTCMVQLLRVHSRSPSIAADSAKAAEDLGAEVVYLTDSFGSMSADDVKTYIETIQSRVKIPLGFQGRNNTERAVDNTLAAFQAGAQWLDGSLMGMGRGAGPTNLEVLISLLQAEGFCKDVDLIELTTVASTLARSIFKFPPIITFTDLLFAGLKLDYYPQELIGSLAAILEIPTQELLIQLRNANPEMVQLRQKDLADFLAGHGLDLNVVLEFLKTGQIPGQSKDETENAKSS